MPIESNYSDIVRTKMTGVVTMAEILEHVKFLCSLDIGGPLWIEFTDQSEAESVNITSQDASHLAQLASSLHARHSSLHNIILAKNPATFGADRMVETHISLQTEKPVWHFVKSKDEAEQLIADLLNSDESQ